MRAASPSKAPHPTSLWVVRTFIVYVDGVYTTALPDHLVTINLPLLFPVLSAPEAELAPTGLPTGDMSFLPSLYGFICQATMSSPSLTDSPSFLLFSLYHSFVYPRHRLPLLGPHWASRAFPLSGGFSSVLLWPLPTLLVPLCFQMFLCPLSQVLLLVFECGLCIIVDPVPGLIITTCVVVPFPCSSVHLTPELLTL